jgi:hypothetical protein
MKADEQYVLVLAGCCAKSRTNTSLHALYLPDRKEEQRMSTKKNEIKQTEIHDGKNCMVFISLMILPLQIDGNCSDGKEFAGVAVQERIGLLANRWQQ